MNESQHNSPELMKLQFKLQSILRNLDLHTNETEKIAFH